MKRIKLALTAVVAVVLLLTLGTSTASADTLTFQITSDHCTGGCLPSGTTSAGLITLTDVSSGVVSVNVTLNSGFLFQASGGFDSVAFDLNGTPTIAYSNITSPWTVVGGSAPSQSAGTYHEDGFGDFQYAIDLAGNGSADAKPGPLNFTVTASGLSAASFVRNAGGAYFIVDIYSTSTGNTGVMDASNTNRTVPDGGMTLMLLGGALVGLEALRRKVRV